MTNNIKSVDETNKIIYFNDITNSSPSTHNYYKFGMQISTIIGDSVDISKLNEDSVILFTATYKDLAGNTLVKGVSGHIFTVAEVSCGIDYVHVNKDQPCYCQSVGNQCQCQCGETYFVKDY